MLTVLSKLRQLLSGKTHDQALTGSMVNRHIELDDATLRRHVSITGRLGRGISLYVEQQLTRQTEQGRGWIYIDVTPDETLLARLAEAARAQGRSDEFYALNLNDPQNSHTYDVLRAGSPHERSIRSLQVLPGMGRPDADLCAQQCLEVLVPLFKAIDASGRTVGMGELGMLVRKLESEAGQNLLAATPAGHDARTSLQAAIESVKSDDETATRLRKNLDLLSSQLIGLGSADYAGAFNNPRPEVNFADILAQNKMCYVQLPVMGKEASLLSLAKMVLHDVGTSIPARSQMQAGIPTPFLCVMDHFHTYGISSGIAASMRPTVFSQARGQAVSLVPVMHGTRWERLRELYTADEIEVLLSNTFTKVYFNQDQGEITNILHPNLPESALDKLGLGEFVACSGAEVLWGAVAPPQPARAPVPYIKRKTVAGDARERLIVGDAPETRG